MRAYWTRVGPNSIQLMALQEWEDLATDRHRTDGHVKTEAEIGILLPQVRGCLELVETGRKGGRIFL